MAAILDGRDDVIAKLTPGRDPGLAHLSDDELLANTRRLVGRSNQLLAALLAHLAEVEARGVHRVRRCASLYTYCIYELRFSEDAAARRSAAARLVKQFPVLFEAIANGELHLTGLLMIGPHLTSENHLAVLGRAKFRTKKELGKLVRDLKPLPQVPDRMEPLGPPPVRAARSPTWEQYVSSLAPPIRELPRGERPGDWATKVDVANDVEGGIAGASVVDAEGVVDDAEQTTDGDQLPVGPVPRDLPPVTGPQHYQVQFSTIEEHAQLVERAKALLARSRPGVTLGELHLEAMRVFVTSLEKRKFAVGDESRRASRRPRAKNQLHLQTAPTLRGVENETVPRQRGALENEALARRRGDVTCEREKNRLAVPDECGETEACEQEPFTAQPHDGAERGGQVAAPPRCGERDVTQRRRSRYIPAAERREVYQRDRGRCTYVDARGERCCETHRLELHHLQPFALHGPSVAANLTLRCSAHNALAAENDFGATLIRDWQDSMGHQALARQALFEDESR